MSVFLKKVAALFARITKQNGGNVFTLYFMTGNFNVVWVGLLLSIMIFFSLFSVIVFIRRKLVLFSDVLCGELDSVMVGEIESPQFEYDESIF